MLSSLGSFSCRHNKAMEVLAKRKNSCTTSHLFLNRMHAPLHMLIMLLTGTQIGQSLESTLTLGHSSVSETWDYTSLWPSPIEPWTRFPHTRTCSFSDVAFPLKDTIFKKYCFSSALFCIEH